MLRSMHSKFLTGLLMCTAACGPTSPGEATDSAATSTSEVQTTGTSADVTTTITTTTEASTTEAPTTGDPTCPPQPSGTLLWATKVENTEDELLRGEIAVTSDGRVAFASARLVEADSGSAWVDGALWFAADGTPMGPTYASTPLDLNFNEVNLRVAPDDSLVLMAERHPTLGDEKRVPYLVRFAPDGAELTRVDVASARLANAHDFELLGDRAVLAGAEEPLGAQLVAVADIATGAVLWETELLTTGRKSRVAVGPGGELVAGDARPGPDAHFKVWRLDAATGSVVWQADLPFPENDAELEELVVTPDGRAIAVALRLSEDLTDGSLVATALALDQGAQQWQTVVAVTNDDGLPFIHDVLVDADALTLPVTRDPVFVEQLLGVEVVSLSFAGELLGSSKPPIPDDPNTSLGHNAARGRCGELLLFESGSARRLMSFAP